MTDIVKRLRHASIVGSVNADNMDYCCPVTIKDAMEAAAEIDRLRHQVASHAADFNVVHGAYTEEREENERLLGELSATRIDLANTDCRWRMAKEREAELRGLLREAREMMTPIPHPLANSIEGKLWGSDLLQRIDAALGDKHD